MTREETGCKHHDDCFTCPFNDCIASLKSLTYKNNEDKEKKDE